MTKENLRVKQQKRMGDYLCAFVVFGKDVL